MRILIACEESQRVCQAFRDKGHEAYSCDILDTSGSHPEWHIKGDVLLLLNDHWDMILAFPPCTHLAASGAPWFEEKRKDGRQQKSIEFFMRFTDLKCPRVAIENPIGIMSTVYRKPDQIIQPYQFGDPARKATCLWLKGLQPLQPTNLVEPEVIRYKNGKADDPWHYNTLSLPPKERARERSKTFPGIAKAMAEQWG